MQNQKRQIVIVSGPPGAGKTTLAIPLAGALGFPLLTKDTIKETLFDALQGESGDLGFSRRIGGAAMHLLWELAGHCPQAVLEANFRPQSSLEIGKLKGLDASIVEVYCRLPLEEAARRYNERAAAGLRHPAHALTKISVGQLQEFDRPLGLGPVIEVDTTKPVDLPRIAEKIRRTLPSPV